MDRVKINDKFQFGLELNVSPYLENYDGENKSEENDYEIFCVLIHRGDAYQGHYHTYIRDVLGEGNWEIFM